MQHYVKTLKELNQLYWRWMLNGHVCKASDKARAEAEKIDPKVFDPAQSYIWFGHG